MKPAVDAGATNTHARAHATVHDNRAAMFVVFRGLTLAGVEGWRWMRWFCPQDVFGLLSHRRSSTNVGRRFLKDFSWFLTPHSGLSILRRRKKPSVLASSRSTLFFLVFQGEW